MGCDIHLYVEIRNRKIKNGDGTLHLLRVTFQIGHTECLQF